MQTSPVEFGMLLTLAQPPHFSEAEVFENTLELAETGERLGYTGAWLLEHHFTRHSICPSPLLLAAHLFGRTSRLRVGSAVSVVPLDHPVRLAEQVAMLDRLSGGRFDFGVGRGSGSKDFPVFGADLGVNHLAMREWVELMVKGWTEDAVESASELMTFPAVPIYPTPVTRPHPPVYIASESPSTIEWAAERGYPMLLSYWLSRETIVSQLELYNETAAAAGHDPDRIDHIASCIVYVDDTVEEARAVVRPQLKWWRAVAEKSFFGYDELRAVDNYKFHLRKWEESILAGQATESGTVGDEDVDKLLRINPVGSPESCAERLQQVVDETGVRHFICGFEAPADQKKAMASMARFAEEVAPLIRAPGGAGGH